MSSNEEIAARLKNIAEKGSDSKDDIWLQDIAALLLKENIFFRTEFENTLAQIEVPGTSNDFYDKGDYVGEIVLMMRKTLQKADEIRSPHA